MSRCIKIPPSGGAETSRYQGADIDVVEKKQRVKDFGLEKKYTWIFQVCKICAFSAKKPTKRQKFYISGRSRYTSFGLAYDEYTVYSSLFYTTEHASRPWICTWRGIQKRYTKVEALWPRHICAPKRIREVLKFKKTCTKTHISMRFPVLQWKLSIYMQSSNSC